MAQTPTKNEIYLIAFDIAEKYFPLSINAGDTIKCRDACLDFAAK